MAIARVQTNRIIDDNKLEEPPDTTPRSPMLRAQIAMSRGPSQKVSNIIWAVVIGLWLIVGYMGSQHFHENFSSSPPLFY